MIPVAMVTHHEFLLDGISVSVGAVSSLLGDDEGMFKQEHTPLFEQLFHSLLDSKHILREGKFSDIRKRRAHNVLVSNIKTVEPL